MTRFITAAIVGSLLAVPSACVTKYDATAPESALAGELTAMTSPDAWVFGSASDAAVADDWASVILDPALLVLIDEALANSPSLRATEESLARSSAFLKQAQSSLYPSLDASISANGASPLEDFEFNESYSGSLSTSWEVDLWGSIDANIAAARFDLVGAEAFYANARQSLISAVAQSYIATIEAKLQRDLTAATLDALLETLRIVQVRRDSGFSSERELVLAKSDVASARDSLEVAEASVRIATRGLELLLGRYPNATLEIPTLFPAIADDVESGLPASLLHRRPDILVAEYDVRAAFADEHVTREGPSLVLSGGLSTSAARFEDLFDPAELALSIGARLAENLFDGGFDDARIAAAEATTRQTLANYGNTVLGAYGDVEDRLDALSVADARSVHVLDAAEAAKETLRLAEIQYREGAVDLLDVLTFRQRSFQADRSYISIQRAQLDARLSLFLALGGAPDLSN